MCHMYMVCYLCESFCNLSGPGLLTRMNLVVAYQMTRLRESLPTYIAFIWFLTRMNPFMACQISRLRESLPTYVTCTLVCNYWWYNLR